MTKIVKNILKKSTGIIFLCLVIVSCKKNEDKTTNYFKINDETYLLSKGILENYGEDEWHAGYNLDLTFFSDGIIVNDNNTHSGSGDMIYFEMISTSSTVLTGGEYNYDNISSVCPVFAFDWSRYCLTWTSSGSNIYTDIISGVLTITIEGNTYDITLTGGLDTYGNSVTARYIGTLRYFDLTRKNQPGIH